MRVVFLLIALAAILILVSPSKFSARPRAVLRNKPKEESSYSFDKRGLGFWQAIDELIKAKKAYDRISSQADIDNTQRLNTRRIPAVNSIANSFEKAVSKFLKKVGEFAKRKKLFDRNSSKSDIDNQYFLNKIKSDLDNYSFDKKGLNFWQAVDELIKAKKIYDRIRSNSDIDNTQRLVLSELDNYSFDKKGLNFWQAVDELIKAKKAYDRISTKSDKNWHFRG